MHAGPREGAKAKPPEAWGERGRDKTGNSRDPIYGLAAAYERKAVQDRAMQTLKAGGMHSPLVEELKERTTRYCAEDPTYRDLVQLVLVKRLESGGREPE